MPPLLSSSDGLFHNTYDLTSTTKTIGTKPFAYGGVSDIWRGVEWGAGATRNVAIKIIRVSTRQNMSLDIDRLKKRISREIVIWNRVAHPNILPLYGLYWVDGPDGLPAMVYPYCEAGNCLDYLNNNTEADRMGILRQVAQGLNHLHSCDPPIAHGDIRATKVLISQDGTPLISNFGLSRPVIESLTISSNSGNYRWMAPELFGGIDSNLIILVSTASDVWAFGCLCVEILLGTVPWASTRSDAAIMLAVVKDRQTPPLPESAAATAIGHIMRHCWVYEPADRPTMVQLVNALVEIDPEHLHTPGCVLLPPSVFSGSSFTLLDSDSDSFILRPLASFGPQTPTKTKTQTDPLFSPRGESVQQRGITRSRRGAAPYLDMLLYEASSQPSLSSSVSGDEPPLFETSGPLFAPGPRRPSRSIRETRQNSQPLWPRMPSSSTLSLPQTLGLGGDDVFRPNLWKRGGTDVRTRSHTDYAKLTFSSTIGASQGRYLTRGSSADVWVIKVEDNEYACKVLRVSTSNFDDEPVISGENQNSQGTGGEVTWGSFVKAYRSQISKWAEVRHANVIRICDHDESLNLHVEYCHYGSVWDYLKTRPSGMAPKQDIIRGVLNGLRYLHTQSPPIIHGSLNAGKIFVDKNHGVKIGEFGLAALCFHAAPYCPSVTFTGFSRWMSPEMLDTDPDNDIMILPTTKSDIWALGCTIFEILAEELPYANYRHDIRIQRAIVGGELPGPPTVDTEYRSILESCWSKSPDERPTTIHLCALNNIKEDQSGPSTRSDSIGPCWSKDPNTRPNPGLSLAHQFEAQAAASNTSTNLPAPVTPHSLLPSSSSSDAAFSGYYASMNRCGVCGGEIRRPWALGDHINSHTCICQRPYGCPHCRRVFTTQSNMQRHIGNFHRSSLGLEPDAVRNDVAGVKSEVRPGQGDVH